MKFLTYNFDLTSNQLVDFFEEWKPMTEYSANISFITYEKKILKCKITHISSNIIDLSNWEIIGGQDKFITPTFCIGATLRPGVQPFVLSIPHSGEIVDIKAISSMVATDNVILDIEKLDTTSNSFISIFTDKKLSLNINSFLSDKTYELQNDFLLEGDILRLNVISTPTNLKGLTVQIKIKY